MSNKQCNNSAGKLSIYTGYTTPAISIEYAKKPNVFRRFLFLLLGVKWEDNVEYGVCKSCGKSS